MKTNCKCLEEMAEKLKTKVLEPRANPPAGGVVKNINATHVSLILSEPTGWRLFIPFTVHWDGIKPRTPGVRDGKTEVNVLASHCPLCGQKFNAE